MFNAKHFTILTVNQNMQVISTNEKRPSKSAFQKKNNTEQPYPG